jgi:hypothetical protein
MGVRIAKEMSLPGENGHPRLVLKRFAWEEKNEGVSEFGENCL